MKCDVSKLKDLDNSNEICICHFINFDDYLVYFQLPTSITSFIQLRVLLQLPDLINKAAK